MRRLRVVWIVPGFSAGPDDWGIPVLRHLARAVQTQHDLVVFALRYPYRMESYTVDGVSVHALGGRRVQGWRRIALIRRAWNRIERGVRAWKPDVIHGFWTDEPGFLATAIGTRLGVPAVVSVMGGELVAMEDIGYGGWRSALNRWLTRRALRQATWVTVGSQFLTERVRPYVDAFRTVLLPLGVDLRMFHPAGEMASAVRDRGKTRLLWVAALAPVKDPWTLLEAFQRVVRSVPDVHLHMVGDGRLRSAVEARIRSLGLQDTVILHGTVNHAQMPAYYRAAHLCVLTSRHESQGMVVLEAAACGRATVGTAVGILPEMDEAGIPVPVGNPTALAEAIVSLLQNPNRMRTMGAAARRWVEARYTLEQTVDRFNVLYRSPPLCKGA